MLLNSSLECWNIGMLECLLQLARAACLHQYGWTAPVVYVRLANTGYQWQATANCKAENAPRTQLRPLIFPAPCWTRGVFA